MMYNYYYDPYAMESVLIGTFAGIYIWMMLLSLAIGIFSIVCFWKIYSKANQPGWAAIVPFYDQYILYKITWGNGWFFLFSFIPIANIVFGIITLVKLAKVFGKDGGWACGLIFLRPIFIAIMAFSKNIVYTGIDGQTSENSSAQGWQSPYQQSSQNGSYQYQRTEQSGIGGYCPYCGAPTKPGGNFCASCGQKL